MVGGVPIRGLATPAGAGDAVSKSYVDGLASSPIWREAVATQADLPGSDPEGTLRWVRDENSIFVREGPPALDVVEAVGKIDAGASSYESLGGRWLKVSQPES